MQAPHHDPQKSNNTYLPRMDDNESGLPIGIQIVPKWKDEFSMFKIGKIIESGVNNNEL